MMSLLIVIFICFIGVGLPDSVLGSAWPVIYQELNLPISLAGYISATVSACTIVSSLMSARVIKRFGVGGVTAASTVMTAAALFGFAFTHHPVWFFVLAVPLGLGAGSIDTALNNFVALHYSASKMNFMHCFSEPEEKFCQRKRRFMLPLFPVRKEDIVRSMAGF